MSESCPACNGDGIVSDIEYIKIIKALTRHQQLGSKWNNEKPKQRGDTCSCDGPAHPYDPTWCRP